MSIKDLQLKFLIRFNPKSCNNVALKMALNGSMQHNKLYKDQLNENKKEEIRVYWISELETFAIKYKNTQQIEVFKEDILLLKKKINNSFSDNFNQEEDPKDFNNGFKLSHAQKSLSVYLKHLWCMGKIGIPPFPPIDRSILALAGFKNQYPSWTKVNDIEQFDVHLKCLMTAAKSTHISEWELSQFEELQKNNNFNIILLGKKT